jgi:hypothetical protein
MMTRTAEWHPTMMTGTAEMAGTAEWHPETTTAAATEAATTTTEVVAAASYVWPVPIRVAMIVWPVTIRVAMVVMGGTNADQLTKLTSTLARTGVALTAGQTDHLTGVHQEDHFHGKCAAVTADHHDVNRSSVS